MIILKSCTTNFAIANDQNSKKIQVNFLDSQIFYMKKIIQTAFIFATMLNASTAFAQQDSLFNKNLEELVVTGQYKPQSLKKSVYQVRVINNERIKQSGAGNVQHRVREVRIAQCGEQRSRPLETELEGTGRARKEVLERCRIAAQDAAHPEAAGRPLMCRSSCPTMCLSSLRDTTWSSIPWSSRNSAVWNPSGRS